ncbi:O-antigen ligase family protein [Candidatus Pelagibacter sp.]|nr:O-antigen ligase family protein [Candidatus Pelagibacter sp.]
MPINFLKFISPEKFKFINSLENISYSSISLSPSNTYFQILNFASLLLIVFICKMIFYTKRHKYRFYYYLSLTGFIASVVAILFYLNGNPDILIFKNSHYKNSSTGFFINRTALAVFLMFCLIASFELLKNYEDNKNIKKNDYFFIKIYVRLFIAFISIGIITSFSRIGNFLLLITILLYLFNEIFYVKRKNYTFRFIILVIVLFDILILGIYFGSSEIINRFYFLKEEFITISGEISTTTRFEIIKFGISELNNFIFFGYGAGGFENLFKLKFINTSSQFANHSHADIIEFLGEFGLIGFLLFLSSFFKFFLRNQNYSFVSILLISYLIIILAFDFTLHIPIIQILFVIFFIFNKKLFS